MRYREQERDPERCECCRDERVFFERGVAGWLTHCSRCGLPVLPGEVVLRDPVTKRKAHPCCTLARREARSLGLLAP